MEDDVGEPTEEAEETESERAVLFVESILMAVIVLFKGGVVVYMVWGFCSHKICIVYNFRKMSNGCDKHQLWKERERGIIYNHATSHWSSASSSIITIQGEGGPALLIHRTILIR